MSGKMRSTPGRSAPAKATPKSTASQVRSSARTEAVEAEIHADLADAAERQEDQFVARAPRHQRTVSRRPPKKTSPAADRLARAVVARRATRRPSLVEGLETAVERTRSARLTADRLAEPAARSSHARRIAAKPRPRSQTRELRGHAHRRAPRTAPPASTGTPSARAKSSPAWAVPARDARTQLTPMPTTTAKRAAGSFSPSTRMPATLRAVEQKIVRPFQLRARSATRRSGASVAATRLVRGRRRRRRRASRQAPARPDRRGGAMRRDCRRAVDPRPPAPAAARGLLGGSDPEPAGIARRAPAQAPRALVEGRLVVTPRRR